jgi:murein peptide amidase A
MQTFQFATSALGLPILGYQFGHSGPSVLILGGVHGNEPEGVVAALGLLSHFTANYTMKMNLTIVPEFNRDGVLSLKRKNGHDVDLNRNMPTKDWTKDVKEEKYYPGHSPNSEPENQALVKWLDVNQPKFVLSLHSWHPCININGACRPEAEVIRGITGYEIKEDIGYPTPGCLGTYCGLERDIPTITYEVERGLDTPSILKRHVHAVIEALKNLEARLK